MVHTCKYQTSCSVIFPLLRGGGGGGLVELKGKSQAYLVFDVGASQVELSWSALSVWEGWWVCVCVWGGGGGCVCGGGVVCVK